MADTEEHLIEDRVTVRNPTVTTISELPGKPFRITVELPLLLTLLSLSLAGAALNNIILYRTCVHSLHYDDAICEAFLTPDKTNVTREIEVEVQRYVTRVYTFKTILESIVPTILSFFLGGWSDTHGRKPLIVWPLFGIAFTSILTVVYAMMKNLGPWWFILTAIPTSLGGGFAVLFIGAFCYLSDITSTKSRSLRMTILEAMISVGSVIGSIASSYLLKEIGNVYLLLIVAALSVLSYAYSTVYLKESLSGAVQSGGITSVLDWLLVKEMFRECFKRRPNYGRAQILLLTVANSLSIFILYGLMSLEYLYAREKFRWSLKDQTIFSAANTTLAFVGAFVGVVFIQRVFPVGDLALAIVAFISSSAEYFIRVFATLTWHMYLGAGVSVFKGLSSPLIRSVMTKIIPIEDIAKVFSLMCALEGISPLVSPAVYNSLYNFTITTFPGAIYLLSGFITTFCSVMVAFVIYYRRNESLAHYRPLEG